MTDPKINNGAPTILPSLWVVGGKAVRVDEDTAVQYAAQSGLSWKSYGSLSDADKAANDRETMWQNINEDHPEAASSIPSLWAK